MAPNSARTARNYAKVTDRPISICTYTQKYCTCVQFSTREIAHARFHDFNVIMFILIFFSKPAISLPEPGEVLIFSQNISRMDGGVHGPQAIASLPLYVSTVDCGVLDGRRMTTPFCCSASVPTWMGGAASVSACALVCTGTRSHARGYRLCVIGQRMLARTDNKRVSVFVRYGHRSLLRNGTTFTADYPPTAPFTSRPTNGL